MSKYRIVSNGCNYKIQEKFLWFWYDVKFFLKSNIFKTEEDAIDFAIKLTEFETVKCNKNYKPVKYLGEIK